MVMDKLCVTTPILEKLPIEGAGKIAKVIISERSQKALLRCRRGEIEYADHEGV